MKERKDIRPLLVKFGVALAISFAGFLYSRIATKRIKPSDSPPPASDSEKKIDYGGRPRITEDPRAETDSEPDTHDKPCIRVCVESSSMNASPSLRCSGDKDGLLLPEFDQLIRQFDMGTATHVAICKKSDIKTFKVVNEPPMAIRSERDEYKEEIENLRNKVKFLQERERNLEIQLLEYYGLKEQEASMMELQNRLKLSNIEAKLLSMKIASLQADNKRLEAQVADYSKVVSELEAAKAKIRQLKKKIRHEAQLSKEQILDLTKRVARLRDLGHEASTRGSDVPLEMQRMEELEAEAEELRKSNEKLQKDNADLARKLDKAQILANAVLEDPEKQELAKEMVHLREENAHLANEVERLQADRCADAEELVYLRWINACLRYELRNYRPPPGKTAARDLSKSLSPKSEAKAKQLILEYANSEDADKAPNIIDFDVDHWPSSQPSYLIDIADSFTSSSANKRTSKKMKFFANLMKVVRGKSRHHRNKSGQTSPIPRSPSVDDFGRRYSLDSAPSEEGTDDQRSESWSPVLASTSQNSNNSSLDQNRLSSLAEEDAKDMERPTGMSECRSPLNDGVRFLLERRNSAPLDYFRAEGGKLEEGQKSELAKYAEALRNARKMHKKCASAYI